MATAKRGSVVNIASDTANIFVFGEISEWWGFSKDEVLPVLRSNRYNTINLYISSPGGDLSEAFVIHDMLRGNRATVNAYLLGQCASAATVIACAADTVTISRQCVYMIHKASFGWLSGVNSDDLMKFAEILDIYDESLVAVYSRKTGLPDAQIMELMASETYMDSPMAFEFGFADELVDSIEIDWSADNFGSVDDEEYDDDDASGVRNPRKKKKYYDVYDQESVYKGAILNLITKGIGYYDKPIASNNLTMNAFMKSIVNALTSAGLIAADKSGDAQAALEKLDVMNSIKNALPEVSRPQVIEALRSLTDEEKAEIFGAAQAAPAVEASDDSELRTQLADLQSKIEEISRAVAGNTGKLNINAPTNGDTGKPDASGKTFKINAAQRQMIEEGYKNGLMPKSVYDSLMN